MLVAILFFKDVFEALPLLLEGKTISYVLFTDCDKNLCLLDKFYHWMNYFIVVFKHKIRGCWYKFQLSLWRYRCFSFYNGAFIFLIMWLLNKFLHTNLKVFLQITNEKCTNHTFGMCIYGCWAKPDNYHAISA